VDEKEKLDELIDEKEKYMQLEKDLNIDKYDNNNDDENINHPLDKDLADVKDKELGLRKTNNRKKDDDEMTV
jgi:hypothetical protein